MNDLKGLYDELIRASAGHQRIIFSRWVMDRASYDRVRAIAVTEEQETARALAHAKALIPVLAAAPYSCPACPAGPFASMSGLRRHAAAMADPTNREPADGDLLLGIRIEVRDDGGEPHIEHDR